MTCIVHINQRGDVAETTRHRSRFVGQADTTFERAAVT